MADRRMRPQVDWLPPGVWLAVTPSDAADLAKRAEAVGITLYRDGLAERRQRDFLAGRLAARAALQRLGAATFALGRDANAVPIWPEGIVGSISHCGTKAAAVVGWRRDYAALGLDLEAQISPERARAARHVMDATEIAEVSSSTDPWRWTRHWSAKEAAYKCLNGMGVALPFSALVPRWVDPQRGEIAVPVNRTQARLLIDTQIIHGLMWALARPG
jgi:4'-phosphopantetheinyl transferase EntD